jgi:hypothetical protein
MIWLYQHEIGHPARIGKELKDARLLDLKQPGLSAAVSHLRNVCGYLEEPTPEECAAYRETLPEKVHADVKPVKLSASGRKEIEDLLSEKGEPIPLCHALVARKGRLLVVKGGDLPLDLWMMPCEFFDEKLDAGVYSSAAKRALLRYTNYEFYETRDKRIRNMPISTDDPSQKGRGKVWKSQVFVASHRLQPGVSDGKTPKPGVDQMEVTESQIDRDPSSFSKLCKDTAWHWSVHA